MVGFQQRHHHHHQHSGQHLFALVCCRPTETRARIRTARDFFFHPAPSQAQKQLDDRVPTVTDRSKLGTVSCHPHINIHCPGYCSFRQSPRFMSICINIIKCDSFITLNIFFLRSGWRRMRLPRVSQNFGLVEHLGAQFLRQPFVKTNFRMGWGELGEMTLR